MSGELVYHICAWDSSVPEFRIAQKPDERELVPTDSHCFSGVAVGTGEATVFAPARFNN